MAMEKWMFYFKSQPGMKPRPLPIFEFKKMKEKK